MRMKICCSGTIDEKSLPDHKVRRPMPFWSGSFRHGRLALNVASMPWHINHTLDHIRSKSAKRLNPFDALRAVAQDLDSGEQFLMETEPCNTFYLTSLEETNSLGVRETEGEKEKLSNRYIDCIPHGRILVSNRVAQIECCAQRIILLFLRLRRISWAPRSRMHIGNKSAGLNDLRRYQYCWLLLLEVLFCTVFVL